MIRTHAWREGFSHRKPARLRIQGRGHVTKKIEQSDKGAYYRELATQLQGLLEGGRDSVANAANFSSLAFDMVPDLN